MHDICARPPIFLLVDKDNHRGASLTQAFEQSQVASKLIVIEDHQALTQYLYGDGQFSNRVTYPLPSIIVLTLGMHIADISTTITWLKTTVATRRLPVVILASDKSQENMSHLYALGAAGFIIRPKLDEELLSMVRSLDDYWSHCARPELAADIATPPSLPLPNHSDKSS